MYLSPLAALFLDLIATFINAYGLIQMKIALQNAELIRKDDGKSDFRRGCCSIRYLLLGAVPVVTANAAHAVTLPFADVSLFTTTCALAILFNMFLSIKLLNE